MRRGEIYRYQPVTARPQPTLRLVVAAQAIVDSGAPVLLCLPVVEDEDPQSLLAPSVGGLGWAVAPNIERTLVSRMTERVGEAAVEEMEQVAVALRAALNLD
jgi:mRNA-degrading endonuclease toxin of MazEF toxin-antitoxin module